MDKNEYNLKLEEIDKYAEQGNYDKAALTADTIDWRRVRNVRTLCMVSEIYEADGRYEDSKALLLRAYRRSPVGRTILYRLVEVTIQLKQFDEAIEYYSEYVQAAPHDNSKYILKYKIYRGRGSSVEEQIDILKEYLDQEYSEKWAYELAKLYQQAGKIQECLAACDDLVLWFHSGKYVIKALELKRRYAALTPKQQEIYDHRFDEEEGDEAKLGQEKQIVETEEDSLAETIMADAQKEIAQSLAEEQEQTEEVSDADEAPAEDGEEKDGVEEISAEERSETTDSQQDNRQEPYDPRELQAEMIKSMREIVAGVGNRGGEPEEDEIAADEIIELSKEEQAAAQRQSASGVLLQRPKVEIPEQKPVEEPGKLSIDDILLSMGERGDEMREAASRVSQRKAPAQGVVSAVDEALVNMEKNKRESDVVTAKTRRISEGEIAKIRSSRNLDWLQTAEAESEEETLVYTEAEEEPVQEETEEASVYAEPEEELVQEETEKTPEYAEPEEEPVQEEEEEQATEQETEETAEEADGEVSEAVEAEEQPEDTYENRMRLKENHRDLFAGFVGIQNMEEQIASAIAQAEQRGSDRTSRSGNILIFGGHGCGKTTIATNIVKAIAQDRGNQFVKMAKIYAADLNRKDIASTIARIAGGTLIIEEAGDLEDAVVDQLTTAMEFRTDGLIIILEDEQKYIHELLMRHPRFTMKFTSQIYIPVFTIDELVRFGQIYAAEQDYVLSEPASAALYERIGGVSAQGDAVSITNVIELVDRAIAKSNKFFRKLTAGRKRYDENNCIILQDKDFK